jgi:hypothetical protein
MAHELVEKAWEAHGGLDRWKCFDMVHATIVSGGQLWDMKHTAQGPTPRAMRVATQYAWASVTPYGAPDQHTDFTPTRIAIERSDGTVVSERLHPAAHAEGKAIEAPWDALDRAYFNRYALWTYLTTPFLFALPGFSTFHRIMWWSLAPLRDPLAIVQFYPPLGSSVATTT